MGGQWEKSHVFLTGSVGLQLKYCDSVGCSSTWYSLYSLHQFPLGQKQDTSWVQILLAFVEIVSRNFMLEVWNKKKAF